jgi:hypothetical protein
VMTSRVVIPAAAVRERPSGVITLVRSRGVSHVSAPHLDSEQFRSVPRNCRAFRDNIGLTVS